MKQRTDKEPFNLLNILNPTILCKKKLKSNKIIKTKEKEKLGQFAEPCKKSQNFKMIKVRKCNS